MGLKKSGCSVIRKQYIKDPAAQDRGYSLAVVVDELESGVRRVYLAGLGGSGNTLEEQTRAAFIQIGQILAIAGGELSDLDEMIVSIPGLDAEKRDLFTSLRRDILGGGNVEEANYPASMLMGTLLASPFILVEIKSSASFPIPKRWRIERAVLKY